MEPAHTGNMECYIEKMGQDGKDPGAFITHLEYLHCLSLRGQKYMNWGKVQVHTAESISISSLLLKKDEISEFVGCLMFLQLCRIQNIKWG